MSARVTARQGLQKKKKKRNDGMEKVGDGLIENNNTEGGG